MKLFEFSYAGFVLSIISSILFLSCARVQKEQDGATTAENTAGSENASSQIEAEEQFKVTVPDDLPEDAVLSFDVPEIPYREMKVISPLPDDADEIKKTVKTAVRQEHILQEDENSKFEESAVQLIRYKAQAFTESLIMHNFSCPQKTDGIPHVIIITETQNIIISGTGFLFGRQIFMKIGNQITLNL